MQAYNQGYIQIMWTLNEPRNYLVLRISFIDEETEVSRDEMSSQGWQNYARIPGQS